MNESGWASLFILSSAMLQDLKLLSKDGSTTALTNLQLEIEQDKDGRLMRR